MIIVKTHKDLASVLLEPKAPGVRDAYFILPADGQNITAIVPGNNGREFNKTQDFFPTSQTVEIINCLYGQGLVVMQRNDEAGEAKEFKLISLNPGKQVIIPAGFGFSVINVGKTFLVFLDNLNPTQVSSELKLKRGFAYYVVEKKGEVAFEPNPLYRIHPQITTE